MKKFNSYVRPYIMIIIGLILFNNYAILPYYNKVIDLPTGWWAFASIFAGTYAAGRSLEKTKNKTNDDDV